MCEPRRDYGLVKTESSPHCRLRSVDLSSVRWTRGFWADQFARCQGVTLPHLWRLLSDPARGHALTNLRIAGGMEEGEFVGTHWQDEWVYKWLEAATAIYAVTRDEQLMRQIEDVIAVIAAAQQPDGYIATQITVRGWERFQDIHHHELYVMGHLISAACLHHRVTGRTTFLDIARRAADFIFETFKGRDPALAHFPFNPTIIMASVELYRTTGVQKYLDLARLFIDMRGGHPAQGRKGEVPVGGDLTQDFVPLREETQVVGHMVTATYLYAGAADVYMETGEAALLAALERLWHDLTERKMYLTGGCAAIHNGLSVRGHRVHEAAGPAYVLPNASGYNETCAQIGNAMWNWRMLAISGDARYADIMERSIYNSVLPGIGLDGASWFYTNVLRWHGQQHNLLSHDAHERFQPDQGNVRCTCAAHICCPSNLLRTVAEWHGYAYSLSEEGLWVNQYGANEFAGRLGDGTRLTVRQETDYPWGGEIELTLRPSGTSEFSLMLRIPAWAEGAQIRVNGRRSRLSASPGSYARLRREWSAGDRVALSLPMKPRLVEAHPRVEETRGQVAVTRGPIVYCLESPDLPVGVRVSEVRIPRNIRLSARYDPSVLGGVALLEGTARPEPEGDWSGRLYRYRRSAGGRPVQIRLIPLYAWANRGVSEMTVWMPLA